MRSPGGGVSYLLKAMKTRLITIIKITAVSVFSFIVLYFIAVLIGGLIPAPGAAAPHSGAPGGGVIILDDNGRHIDIWLPSGYCGFLAEAFPPEADGWYGFGWGDRDFFLNTPRAENVKAGLLLKALFLPSRSVLAVQFSLRPPSGREVPASEENLSAAADYIKSWFISGDKTFTGVPEYEVNDSYYGYRFFESKGLYSIFFTSNNWVNRVFKSSAGLPAKLWTPLTFGID